MDDSKVCGDDVRPVSPDSLSSEVSKSRRFTEYEHELSFWHAVRLYWPAVAWTLFINLAVVLKGKNRPQILFMA